MGPGGSRDFGRVAPTSTALGCRMPKSTRDFTVRLRPQPFSATGCPDFTVRIRPQSFSAAGCPESRVTLPRGSGLSRPRLQAAQESRVTLPRGSGLS
eukprot:14517532-Alexandrium_andersonii.AAC.1